MNFHGRFLIAASSLALGASALAISADNPYKVIFERNAFKLNPPLKEKPVEQPQEAPLPNVELTGFSQVGDEKKAWFMISPTKPGPNEQPQYVSLRAGERTAISGGSIELKELNDAREETRVLISGKEATYTMKHAPRSSVPGMQAPPGGAVPPPPTYVPNGAPRAATPFAPAPQAGAGQSGVISGTSSSVVAGQGSPLPTVQSTLVPKPAAAAPQVNSLTVQSLDGAIRVPTRTVRLTTGAAQNGVIATPPAKPMTAEESIIAVEVNRELTKDAVARKELPPLPPTPLSEGK